MKQMDKLEKLIEENGIELFEENANEKTLGKPASKMMFNVEGEPEDEAE